MLALAAEVAQSPRAILDVGCGTGSLLQLARERFPAASLSGVDPSAEMLAAAAPKLTGADLRRARAEELPFADGSFDLLLSTNSFHHWLDQPAGARELGRVSAPGAHVVLADPFAIGWLRVYATLAGKQAQMRTQRDVAAMLSAAGLRVVSWRRVFAVGPLPIITAVVAVDGGA